MATDPKAVAAAGLAGLARNKPIVVPGLMNKMTSQAGRILPRSVLRRAVAALKG
jgi:short-subunit dehydrogenase